MTAEHLHVISDDEITWSGFVLWHELQVLSSQWYCLGLNNSDHALSETRLLHAASHVLLLPTEYLAMPELC